MNYAVQFVKIYNKNTKQSKIIFDDGQEKTITLSIDAVCNAFAMDIIAKPYVDLQKLGNKLEGVATYESHKQWGGSISHPTYRRPQGYCVYSPG